MYVRGWRWSGDVNDTTLLSAHKLPQCCLAKIQLLTAELDYSAQSLIWITPTLLGHLRVCTCILCACVCACVQGSRPEQLCLFFFSISDLPVCVLLFPLVKSVQGKVPFIYLTPATSFSWASFGRFKQAVHNCPVSVTTQAQKKWVDNTHESNHKVIIS